MILIATCSGLIVTTFDIAKFQITNDVCDLMFKKDGELRSTFV